MSTQAERLAERLSQEEPLLRRAFPGATIDIGAMVVILADHRLPAGWSHDRTDVLVAIPPNYPGGQPDNVCARPDLTLKDDRVPGNTQGIQNHAFRQWLQFSYHVEPGDWRPSASPSAGSNLVEYLTGALTRFDEAS
jgi:hypothetical protein